MCVYFVPSSVGFVLPDFILHFNDSTENYMFMSTLIVRCTDYFYIDVSTDHMTVNAP